MKGLFGQETDCVTPSNGNFTNLAQYFMGLGDSFDSINLQCFYVRKISHSLLSLAEMELFSSLQST